MHLISSFAAALVALCPCAPAQARPSQPRPLQATDQPGEALDLRLDRAEAVVETMAAVQAREAALGDRPFVVKRARPADAHGYWEVPSPRHTAWPHSGDHYIDNRWGDLDMSLGFGELVNLEGAYIAAHGNEGNWAVGLVVIGYRDGLEVGRTGVFRDIDETPSFFLMDLVGVDRVEFRAEASACGAGWYGLDDLSFLRRGDGTRFGERVTLDFEEVPKRTDMRESDYGGISWEAGGGHFEDPAVVHAPLTPPTGELRESSADLFGGGQFFGGGGTLPDLHSSFVGPKISDNGAGWLPPDTCGAVGPEHFVAVVNQHISIYLKSNGNRLVNASLQSFFNTSGSAGDPRAAYDAAAGRWIVTGCDFNTRIFLGYSLTSDPTGAWFKTPITVSQGADANRWPDYPGLGVDANGIYFTANMFPNGGAGFGATIIAIDKAPLLAGSPSLGAVTAWRSLSGGSLQPCITYGNAGAEYVADLTGSSMRLRRVNPPLSNPTLSTLSNVSIGSWSSPPNAPAQGSSGNMDTLDGRLMNALWRNGSVWATHGVSRSNRAAVRWYQVAVPGMSLVQSGTIDDPSLHYYMPSIAVNAADEVALGFSASNANQYVGAYWSGRLPSDPSGQAAVPQPYRTGIGPYNNNGGGGSNRWGDYSLTTVDPSDDASFWTIQEYARSNNEWGTFIAELGYPVACPAPTNYCTTSINSTGVGALMLYTGTTGVLANDFVLAASGCPANKVGLFYYGSSESAQAFGNGTRCIGGSTTRLPIISTDAFGFASYTLDLPNLPPGGAIQAGDTRKFQFWYRDPAGGGAAFNLSDGLSATFCP